MSFWKNITAFVKNVLYRDDDYALCKVYNQECEKCPKKDKCKKASLPSYFKIDSIQNNLTSSESNLGTGNDKFVFMYNDEKLLIKFGAAFIELHGDGCIKIHGTTITADGNFGAKNGLKSGVLCLFTQGIVQNGIVIGELGGSVASTASTAGAVLGQFFSKNEQKKDEGN